MTIGHFANCAVVAPPVPKWLSFHSCAPSKEKEWAKKYMLMAWVNCQIQYALARNLVLVVVDCLSKWAQNFTLLQKLMLISKINYQSKEIVYSNSIQIILGYILLNKSSVSRTLWHEQINFRTNLFSRRVSSGSVLCLSLFNLIWHSWIYIFIYLLVTPFEAQRTLHPVDDWGFLPRRGLFLAQDTSVTDSLPNNVNSNANNLGITK